ncbi:MAG: phosphodiesterase [Planctomyces sp.]|nr:phosphodiesterase [Planctomyces sp.]
MKRILQLTDLHVFADENALLKGIPTRHLLKDVLKAVSNLGLMFDHVVVTGDHTHDELPESYQAVRELLEPWIGILRQVPGNHDDRSVLRSVFSDRIPGNGSELVQFWFTAEQWLCVGLDTHLPGEVSGQIQPEQIEWLETHIKAHPDYNVILFMHHPPVDLNSVWMDRIGLKQKELLQALVLRTPQVRLICCGHVHHESTISLHTATVVTTPSTGIQFDPTGDAPHFVKLAPGFRIIELDNDRFSTRVIRLPEAHFTPTN